MECPFSPHKQFILLKIAGNEEKSLFRVEDIKNAVWINNSTKLTTKRGEFQIVETPIEIMNLTVGQ